MFKINILPLQQDAILEALPGIHSNIKDDFNFCFIADLHLGIIKNVSELFFLLSGERKATNCNPLFLAFLAFQYLQVKRIITIPVFTQGIENFTQSDNFPVMS